MRRRRGSETLANVTFLKLTSISKKCPKKEKIDRRKRRKLRRRKTNKLLKNMVSALWMDTKKRSEISELNLPGYSAVEESTLSKA